MWIVLKKPEKKKHNWIIKMWFIYLRALAAWRQIYATFKAANQQIHRNSSSDRNVDFNNEEINTDLANAFPTGKKIQKCECICQLKWDRNTYQHIIMIILEFREETVNLWQNIRNNYLSILIYPIKGNDLFEQIFLKIHIYIKNTWHKVLNKWKVKYKSSYFTYQHVSIRNRSNIAVEISCFAVI